MNIQINQLNKEYLKKLKDRLLGRPKTDNAHTVEARKIDLTEKIKEVKDLIKMYQIAKMRTEDAKRQEALILSQLQSKEMELTTEYQRTKGFLQLNDNLIEHIPLEQEELYVEYKKFDKKPAQGDYDKWKENKDLIYDQMHINDKLYFDLTGKFLTHHELFTNTSSSSSSSSTDNRPLLEPSYQILSPQQESSHLQASASEPVILPDAPPSSALIPTSAPQAEPAPQLSDLSRHLASNYNIEAMD